MIVVSTNTDPVSGVLSGYAAILSASVAGSVAVPPPTSSSAQINRILSAYPGVTVFLFGHGVPPPATGFIADNRLVVLDPISIPTLLPGRVVAATCCHGHQIGVLASAHRFAMVGYRGDLWVALKAPYVQLFQPSMLAAPYAISTGAGVASAEVRTRSSFSGLAQSLYKRNRPGDRPASLYASLNAQNVGSW